MARKSSRRSGRGALYRYSTKSGERWRWQLYAPVDAEQPDGELRRIGGGGFTTAGAADDALRAALTKLKNQEAFATRGAPRLDAFARQWLDSLRLEASTIQGYEKIVRNHVTPYLGDLRVDKVTATRLARHYRELGEHGRKDSSGFGRPLSANSVNKVHVVIGAMLDAAIDDGLISQNPARKKRTVQAPTGKQIRSGRPEIETWTSDEMRTFLTWNRDIFDDELHVLWRTLAYTGMRRSEALALRWSDVDFASSRISIRRAADVTTRDTVKTTKTGGARVVDIDATTAALLKEYRAKRGSIALTMATGHAVIFGNLDGAIRSPNEISRRWSYRVRAAQSAGVDVRPLTIKGLRHTHATLLLELGEHPKVVQERLGHSSITTTMNIYSHVTPTMQRAAVQRLENLISGS